MSVLEITALSHSFGDKELYRGADLMLHKGEHMGVIGANGAGKSTLLKILLGEMVPTGGRILWQRNLSIGHIDQHEALDGNLTIEAYLRGAFAKLYAVEKELADIYRRMGEGEAGDALLRRAAAHQERLSRDDFYAVDSHIGRVASGLGLTAIGMDRPLSTLSGGQRTRAMLAKLLLRQPDVLLLDEPTNYLDAEHIDWLAGTLSAFPGSFLVVSHDTAFLDRITTCICDIAFLALRKYHGRYSEVVRQKEHQHETLLRKAEAQRREIEKLETYIAKNKVRAATAKMAKSRQKQLDRMDRVVPVVEAPRAAISFVAVPLTVSHALSVAGLRVGYAHPLLPPLGFSVAGGQKVAITGFNGIGKSTLLKTLVGTLPALGGSFTFAPSVRIGYFEQDLRWEDAGRTPLEIMMAAYPSLSAKQARAALSRFGLRAEHAMRPIASLSGGEQNKVKLCRFAMKPCNFLVLDEPTNHLDAQTKASLRDAILAFPGSVLLVCHEAAFLRGLVDRVIDMEKLLK